MNAIYLVTDDRLSDIAGLQAQRLAEQWQCDVHIFVERRDPAKSVREFRQNDRIRYHYEKLGDLVPEGLPEDRKWPRIVYMRLFAPSVLAQYDRLLYLDADILSLRAEPAIWNVELPAGIGAVSDIATLDSAPYDMKGVSREKWLASIGVTSGRYLNSGMLLIDTAKWLRIDFATELRRYFAAYPEAARYDQDFLAHLFDGRWTELSPRLNYQAYVMELGLTRAIAPVFVHFCRTQKPWYGDSRGWRAPTAPGYTEIYQEMFRAAGLDPEDYTRPNKVNAVRRARYRLRLWLRRFGVISGRERRDIDTWQKRSDAFLHFMQNGLATGQFADESRKLLDAPRCAPVFDGRFAVGVENRPDLQEQVKEEVHRV
ncbi:glycosyltransferase family 8 protein [Paenirhodobacter sp.]|uniref:glycosyltransferase family 8 protein n=1 Tax=Paenirhodobacter sp. TaxID=1965326 RepID=UPI003B3CFFC3